MLSSSIEWNVEKQKAEIPLVKQMSSDQLGCRRTRHSCPLGFVDRDTYHARYSATRFESCDPAGIDVVNSSSTPCRVLQTKSQCVSACSLETCPSDQSNAHYGHLFHEKEHELSPGRLFPCSFRGEALQRMSEFLRQGKYASVRDNITKDEVSCREDKETNQGKINDKGGYISEVCSSASGDGQSSYDIDEPILFSKDSTMNTIHHVVSEDTYESNGVSGNYASPNAADPDSSVFGSDDENYTDELISSSGSSKKKHCTFVDGSLHLETNATLATANSMRRGDKKTDETASTVTHSDSEGNGCNVKEQNDGIFRVCTSPNRRTETIYLTLSSTRVNHSRTVMVSWNTKNQNNHIHRRRRDSNVSRLSNESSRYSNSSHDINPGCSFTWNARLHSTVSGCERCLYLATPKARKEFDISGHHPSISRTRGGCLRTCQFFPRESDGHPVRLCCRCFNNVHQLKLSQPNSYKSA